MCTRMNDTYRYESMITMSRESKKKRERTNRSYPSKAYRSPRHLGWLRAYLRHFLEQAGRSLDIFEKAIGLW